MWQIRVHGRGGQGVVTAAELLADAAFRDGYEVQAFPSFGSERMGAPVTAYCRLDTRPIRIREPVVDADALLVIDASLLRLPETLAGLRTGGWVLVNSARTPQQLGVTSTASADVHIRWATVPATALARRYLGRVVPNAPMLGAFAALTRLVSLTAIEDALSDRFTAPIAEQNIRAARAAFASLQQVVTSDAQSA